MSNVFGADAVTIAEPAGSWLGGKPGNVTAPQKTRTGPQSKMVSWARRVNGSVKRERQEVTEEMRRNTNMAKGDTPWWKSRPKWKISTKLNYCATVPLTWTAILCDAKPTVNYTALDRSKQARADVATAAWNQAYMQGNWEQKIHDAVLVSRVQKKAYLRLTPSHLSEGGTGKATLTVVLGEQVYMDRNATCVDDAEIIMYEYRESYGSLCARFRDQNLRQKISRKYAEKNDDDGSADVAAPPASYRMPDGTTVNTPAYGASANPPESASGSSGILVREYWTRPHKTIDVDEVQFLTTGEPATRPKMYDTIEPQDSEPLRRVLTEGGVLYELPESLVNAMYDAMGTEGIQVLDDQPCLEAIKHKVRYPLYPQGRLLTIVDEDIEADDRMNPLGYIPFAEISANSALDGGLYGPSDIDLIADAYEQLVRLVCLVHDTANLTGNSIWRVPENSSISNDDITNAPGSIQREDMNMLRYGKREQAPELPNYIMQQIRFLVEQIKELSGLSDIMLGKMPPKAQISTETTTMAQDASGVRFRDSLASLSRATFVLGEQFLELMARFYTSPVMVQVKNAAGVPEATPMLGAYLTDQFSVEARAGSRQPSGPSARLTTLMNLKSAGVLMDMDTVYELCEELGAIPSASALTRRIEALMKDPSQRWKLMGMGDPAGQQPKKLGSKRQRRSVAFG